MRRRHETQQFVLDDGGSAAEAVDANKARDGSHRRRGCRRLRINVLRCGHALLVIGLGLTVWPEVSGLVEPFSLESGVVRFMLAALSASPWWAVPIIQQARFNREELLAEGRAAQRLVE